jgi:hypothetical protein
MTLSRCIELRALDTYETDSGEVIGQTLADCVEWARQNPEAFAKTNVWWLREDDAEAIIVDRDIQDEINHATGEWFGPEDVRKSPERNSTSTAREEQAA